MKSTARSAPAHDVVVCVHDAYDDVKACLNSLVANWDTGTLSRLIVVDDASQDDTSTLLAAFASKHSYITVLRLAEQSFYTKAANIGLLESDAPIRTLLNSDTIVLRGWATGIARLFASYPSIGIVGPLSNAASTQSVPFVGSGPDQTAINLLPEGVSIASFGKFVRQAAADLPVPFVPLIHGFCLSMSEAVIQEVGLFDEEAFPRGYGEETDLCFRAEDAGFILAIAIDTFVFHAKSKSYASADRTSLMRDGMSRLVSRYGERRLKTATRFMQENPILRTMRRRVFANWASFYGALSNPEADILREPELPT